MTSPTSPHRISVGQFFSGLFAALAEQGRHQVYRCGEAFNQAVSQSFGKFREEGASHGIKPAFLIVLHRIYRDSEVIEQGLAAAVLRDLISYYNPAFERFQLTLTPDEARAVLDDLPGGPEIYRQLAEDFFSHYQQAQHSQPSASPVAA